MSCLFQRCRKHQNLALSGVALATLSAKFNLQPEEVLTHRARFNRMCHGEGILFPDFREHMGLLGLYSTSELADRIYSVMDRNKVGQVSFEQYLLYMNVLLHGTDDEKAEQSFLLITKGRVDAFRFEDFAEMLLAVWKLYNTISGKRVVASEERIRNLFSQLDLNQDGRIDLEEYKLTWKSQPKLFQWLRFLTSQVTETISSTEVEEKSEPDWSTGLTKLEGLMKQCLLLLEGHPKDFDTTDDSILTSMIRTTSGKVKNHWRFRETSERRKSMSNEVKSYTFRPTLMPVGPGKDLIFGDLDPAEEWSSFLSFDPTPSTAIKQPKASPHMTAADLLHQAIAYASFLREGLSHPSPPRRTKQRKDSLIVWSDKNWDLVLNTMLGIQKSIKDIDARFNPEAEINDKEKVVLPVLPLSCDQAQARKKIYEFIDYAPGLFEHMRRDAGISATDYVASLGVERIVQSLLLGTLSSLEGLNSTGKSGSFFFCTDDNKYMLKTLTKAEFSFLRSILKEYFLYKATNYQSLLTQFYGLHKLKYSKMMIQKRVYLVVMGNVFNCKDKEIHQRFDLKGSSLGRSTDSSSDMSIARKDLDFKKLGLKVNLPPRARARFLEQVQTDCEFLVRLNIIDYSLLVGIHHIDNEEIDTVEQGFPSADGTSLYFLGIIDILTAYSMRKKLEFAAKSVLYGTASISCVPPRQYADRFLTFLRSAFAE